MVPEDDDVLRNRNEREGSGMTVEQESIEVKVRTGMQNHSTRGEERVGLRVKVAQTNLPPPHSGSSLQRPCFRMQFCQLSNRKLPSVPGKALTRDSGLTDWAVLGLHPYAPCRVYSGLVGRRTRRDSSTISRTLLLRTWLQIGGGVLSHRDSTAQHDVVLANVFT